MNDGILVFSILMVYICTAIAVICAIWHIIHYIETKQKITIKIILKWVGYSMIVIPSFLSTGELPKQITKIIEIQKNELLTDYKLNNDISTGKQYNFYKFVNIKTGNLVVLPANEYLKINCSNFKINIFEIKRVEKLLGTVYVHNYYDLQSTVECI